LVPKVMARESCRREPTEGDVANPSEPECQPTSSAARSQPLLPEGASNDQAVPRMSQRLPPVYGKEHFGSVVSVVISANIVLLAVETDYPELWAWVLCDFAFLLLFIAENAFVVMAMREDLDRCWILFDVALVVAGTCEVLIPLCQEPFTTSSEFLALRLLRLLRLLKLFKFSKRLAALAMALLKMIEPFTLIFGVLFLFILTGAIFCTTTLGRIETGTDRFSSDEVNDLQDSWGTVYTAVFTLFQITTLDNWMEVAGPVAATDWRWQLFFVIFISFGSWTMISILTAVASDSMVAAASDREEIEGREREALRENFLNFLRDAFLEADADGNGVMDSDEFETLIKKESVINYMSGHGVGVTVQDLQQAWETLDASAGRTGELTIDEFVTGFLTLSKGISTHDIANVDYGLRKTSGQAATRIQRLTKLVQDVRLENEQVISSLEQYGQMQREQLDCLGLWRDWAYKQDPQLLQKAVFEAEEVASSVPPSDAPS